MEYLLTREMRRHVPIPSSCRSQIIVHLFLNEDSSIVHRAVAARTPGGGNAATGRCTMDK